MQTIEMDDSFTVMLISNECTSFFSHNTSCSFSNILPQALNLSQYEVALQSISYYDGTEEQVEMDELPNKREEKVPVFKSLLERNITDEIIDYHEFRITKTNPVFSTFFAETNRLCKNKHFDVAFMPYMDKGKITGITLRINITHDETLRLSPNLASLLGFEQRDFNKGDHKSKYAPNLNSFETLSLGATLGEVRKSKLTVKTATINQILGSPTINEICTAITLALETVGVTAQLRYKKGIRTIEWRNLVGTRITFSSFLNSFLGLTESFKLPGNGSQVVTGVSTDPPPIKTAEDTDNTSPNIFVICDRICDQIVAGELQNCLCLVERRLEKTPRRYHYAPQTMVYKEVCKQWASHISISLQTGKTSFLKHHNEATFVVLHFRRLFRE